MEIKAPTLATLHATSLPLAPASAFLKITTIFSLVVFLGLGLFPPHSLDIAISNFFYQDHAFILNGQVVAEFVHSFGKIFVIALLLLCLYVLSGRFTGKREDADRRKRAEAWYVILALTLCLSLTALFKKITGMSCPWDLLIYGGNESLATPFHELIKGNFSGKCWPSGFAGSAFCLYAICFVPSFKRHTKIIAFALVTVLGLSYGILQIGRGAHFLSHVIASMALDYTLCALALMILNSLHFFSLDKVKTVTSDKITKQQFAGATTYSYGVKGIIFHALLISLWWNLLCSLPFWQQALVGGLLTITNLRFAFACGIFLIFSHSAFLIVLNALLPTKIFKILTIALSLAAATGGTFAITLNVAMTPEMITNALQTDLRETYELLNLRLITTFVLLFVPTVWLTLRFIPKKISFIPRIKIFTVALLLLIAGCGALFTDFSSSAIYMREHHEARYYLAPSDVISSGIRTVFQGSASTPKIREVVDPSPVLLPSRKTGRPVVVVTVVGETTRAKNWGLSGYSRNTTPELAKRGVINFSDMNSCGTDTATSVPCVFSQVGRRDYSRSEILKQEPLPVLIQRAGVNSLWIDNQSGSKGAADGINYVNAKDLISPQEQAKKCTTDSCFDGILKNVLNQEISKVQRTSAFYLHLMGSHGPTYRLRYEDSFNHWGPVCDQSDLRQCSLKELRNAYDNSVLYTDSVLSSLIDTLKTHKDLDTVLVYFSDHGESLGENGFFLHGAPYAISPDVQTKVPMIMWFSDGFKQRTGLNEQCLLDRATQTASHDNMWSTLLKLNGVQSSTYLAQDDLLASCMNEK